MLWWANVVAIPVWLCVGAMTAYEMWAASPGLAIAAAFACAYVAFDFVAESIDEDA